LKKKNIFFSDVAGKFKKLVHNAKCDIAISLKEGKLVFESDVPFKLLKDDDGVLCIITSGTRNDATTWTIEPSKFEKVVVMNDGDLKFKPGSQCFHDNDAVHLLANHVGHVNVQDLLKACEVNIECCHSSGVTIGDLESLQCRIVSRGDGHVEIKNIVTGKVLNVETGENGWIGTRRQKRCLTQFDVCRRVPTMRSCL
jgi:hypothetical protein